MMLSTMNIQTSRDEREGVEAEVLSIIPINLIATVRLSLGFDDE